MVQMAPSELLRRLVLRSSKAVHVLCPCLLLVRAPLDQAVRAVEPVFLHRI